MFTATYHQQTGRQWKSGEVVLRGAESSLMGKVLALDQIIQGWRVAVVKYNEMRFVGVSPFYSGAVE